VPELTQEQVSRASRSQLLVLAKLGHRVLADCIANDRVEAVVRGELELALAADEARACRSHRR